VRGTASGAHRCTAVFTDHRDVVLASAEGQQIPIDLVNVAELGTVADVDLSALYGH